MTPRSRRAIASVAENLRFFTRLPVGASKRPPDFSQIGWATPIAGAVVGGVGAGVFVGCHILGLPRGVSATLAVAAELGVTGGLHEDGLADVADGFGGGNDPSAKLTIMRDSRIGAFGAMALFIMLLLRIEAIDGLARSHLEFAALGLVLAAAAARAATLVPLVWAAPARIDGIGASAGTLDPQVLYGVAVTLGLLAAGFGILSLGVVRAFFACVIGFLAARGFVAFAKQQIGGQTGDVCGATAMIVEVVVLLALLVGGQGFKEAM